MPSVNTALLFDGLGEVTDALLAHWLVRVPAFRRAQYDRYRFREDKVRSVAAFCLLAVALGRIPPAFRFGQYGKPELPDGGVHFSMSHAGDCVAVVVAEAPVGIDVEEVREAPFEVMGRVFTPREIRSIENACDKNRAFFTVWTLKESYIKKLGAGLSFDLQQVEFVDDKGCFVCSDPRFVFSRFEWPGWQAAICGDGDISLLRIGLEEFIQRWDRL